MSAEFDFHEYGDGPVRLGPFTIHTSRLVHPIPAYGLRVEADGQVVVYSGDTGPCQQLVDLARGADVLLCEAAFVESGDNPADLHLTGKQAGVAAAEAGVGRLVLTHIPPWHHPDVPLAEAREAFHGPLEAAATGSTYDFTP
jgi:ribonuclease BN (tRNA processing enzyme)